MPRVSRVPKIGVSPTFLLTIAVHLWFGLSAWLKNLLLAALLHECGHAIALWYFGVPIRSVRLTSLGAVLAVGETSYRTELICAAAGPAVNALLAIVAFRPFPAFGLCNLGLLGFNLLPLYPLDGGRMLRAALRQRLEPVSAERAECRIAVGSACAVMLASVLLGRFITHDLFPPLIASSVLLRPIAAESPRRRTQFPLDKGRILR